MRNFVFLLLILSLVACKVNQYPTSGNYVYKTIINVEGISDANEKKALQLKLERQLDDSLFVSTEKKKTKGLLGFIKHNVKIYHNFDTNQISRTIDFFKAAYTANGYFRGGVTSYKIEPFSKENKRAQIISFTAQPFRNHRMDSIAILFRDTSLQNLANNIKANTLLKKNDLYAQDILDLERRRLITHFKNNGYLFISKDDIKVVVDTINAALLKIPNDPFEEQIFLQKAAAFEANPTTSITLLLKDTVPENKLKKYYIGKVYIQPDNLDRQITPTNSYSFNKGKFIKQYYQDNFKNKLFENNVFLNEGDLYKEANVEKTIMALNRLAVWKQLNVQPIEKSIRNDTIDFMINLYPLLFFQSERKVEGTSNKNNSTSSFTKQLWGINVYQNVKNLNINHKATIASLTFNVSNEFGRNDSSKNNIFNTLQYGTNLNFQFPQLSIVKKWNYNPNINNQHSFLNFNGSQSQRFNKYSFTEFGAGYGSVFKWKHWKREFDIQVSIPSIEIKTLFSTSDFKNYLDSNPNLKNIYRDGYIFSLFNGVTTFEKTIRENIINQTSKKSLTRISSEFSLPIGTNSFFKDKVYTFSKIEYDKRYYFNRPLHRTWALRIYTGCGFSYDKKLAQNKTLPFFKQFIGGGPNSLRAWPIRSVSSYSTRTKTTSGYNEYFGDVQVEANIEHRHNLTKVLGFQLQGAAFIDMGNIWNWKPIDPTVYPTNISKQQKIIDDIAIATGYGIRLDIGYFLIRFDLATKFKDPRTITGEGGVLLNKNFNGISDIKMQLGINMPF